MTHGKDGLGSRSLTSLPPQSYTERKQIGHLVSGRFEVIKLALSSPTHVTKVTCLIPTIGVLITTANIFNKSRLNINIAFHKLSEGAARKFGQCSWSYTAWFKRGGMGVISVIW